MDKKEGIVKSQTSSILQQKVFKFHNIHEDAFNGKSKKKRLTEKTNTPKKTNKPRKKMAQMINKQFTPIKNQCSSVQPLQQGSNNNIPSKKDLNLEKAPNILPSSQITCLETSLPSGISFIKSKLEEDKPPNRKTHLKLVDISLLKDPKANKLDQCEDDNIAEPDICTNEERNYSKNFSSSSQLEYCVSNNNMPLDLTNSRKADNNLGKDASPVDLSWKKSYPNACSGISEEPPPLVPINRGSCKNIATRMTCNQNVDTSIKNKRTLYLNGDSTYNTVQNFPKSLGLFKIQTNSPFSQADYNQVIFENKDVPILKIEQNKPEDEVRRTEEEVLKPEIHQNMGNQIFILIPKGQCIQALPKQNDSQATLIQNNEEIKKIISRLKPQPKTNTKFSQGMGISISERDSNCNNQPPNIFEFHQPNQNKYRTVPKEPGIPNCDMVKTNETHTGNGGLYCTFRNVKKGKLRKAKSKKRK